MESSNTSERIEELLHSKDFDQLNEEERRFVHIEIGSQEHYEMLRRIAHSSMPKGGAVLPDPYTLTKLQSHLRLRSSASSFAATNILQRKVPAYSVAMLILAFGLLWYLKDRYAGRDVTPAISVVHDTVYIPLKADTVYVERVIVKYRNNVSKRKGQLQLTNTITPQTSEDSDGVSMKEKEELQDLLVSGS